MEFFFDTETTGLPQRSGAKYASPKNLAAYDSSRIVSISWIVTQQQKVVNQAYFKIKPDGFVIPEEATKIHGITNEDAHTNGCSINVVFDHLREILPLCNTVVAHNAAFDVHILESEMHRYGEQALVKVMKAVHVVCTMKKGKQVLNMKTYPKLGVLYKALYGEEMQNAHDAQYDTLYCYKCYIKMFPVDKSIFFFGNNPVNLTPTQCDIVHEDQEKNILVVACAGAGKTLTVLCRVKHLIESCGISEDSILMTTFTRDAANEMKNKLFDIMGYAPAITVGTIDSIAKRFSGTGKALKDVSEYAFEFLAKIRADPSLIAKYKYIFVDEFQDINDVQFNIIQEFYKQGCKIFAVGDDAQNIYSFRGSKIEFILNFNTYFQNTTTRFLIENFRSTSAIIDLANASMEKNENSIPKKMVAATKETGTKPLVRFFTSNNTQNSFIVDRIIQLINGGVAPHDIVVLSPVNQSLYMIEEQLTKQNVDNVYLDGKCDVKTTKKPWHVCLSTVHKSKGLEWDHVFLINMSDEIIPKTKTPLQIEESRRLFYVGITRARRELTILYTVMLAACPYVTRFISELDPNLYTTENMSPQCFGKSDLDIVPLEMSVTRLIENLDGADYIILKERGILPNISTKDIQKTKIYESFSYNSVIEQNDLYSDFGIFVEKLIKRELGRAYQTPRLCKDKHVIMCLANVKLDAKSFIIYQQYRGNFKTNLRLLKPYLHDVHGNKYRIKCILENNGKFIQDMHMSTLLMILMSIRQKAEYYGIEPHEVPVFSKSFLPSGFEASMEASLLHYRSIAEPTDISCVWEMAKCKKIVTEYRRRLLYKNVEVERDLMPDYNRLHQNIITTLMTFIQTMTHGTEDIATDEQFELKEGVFGELDLRIGDTIIDYKTSINEDLTDLQWLVQLLCYKALADANGKSISKVGILNALRGWYGEIDVSSWNKHHELIGYLIEKRDTLRTAAQH